MDEEQNNNEEILSDDFIEDAKNEASDKLISNKYNRNIITINGLKKEAKDKLLNKFPTRKNNINNNARSNGDASNNNSNNSNTVSENNSYDAEDDNDLLDDMRKKGISKLIKGVPLKTKIIIIAIIASIFMFFILFIILLTPLSMLLLFDDSGSDDVVNGSNLSYVDTNSSENYWWPIGGSVIETLDGVEFSTGNPTATYISSDFDPDRVIYGKESPHYAIDIASSGKTDYVIAAVGGQVVKVNDRCSNNGQFLDGNESTCGGGYGNYIKIKKPNSNIYFVYAHLYPRSIKVKEGDIVKQGQYIAIMGNSGNTTGTHLHFQINDGCDGSNCAKNPLLYLKLGNYRPVDN